MMLILGLSWAIILIISSSSAENRSAMTATICRISSHIRSVTESSIAPLTVRSNSPPYGFIGFKPLDVEKDVVLHQCQAYACYL